MARGLARLQTVQVTGEVVEGEKKDEEKGYDRWELEDACRTLERAAEIQADTKLMAALKPHLEKKINAIKSLEDLRSLARTKSLKKN